MTYLEGDLGDAISQTYLAIEPLYVCQMRKKLVKVCPVLKHTSGTTTPAGTADATLVIPDDRSAPGGE